MMNSGMEEWTPDGSAFYAANPSLSIYLPERWRVHAATGNGHDAFAGRCR
jgi:hypothetical protein